MFKNHITDFNQNLIGLRDFVEIINPYLDEKLKEHSQHFFPLLKLGLLKETLSSKENWKENEKESLEKEILETSIEIKKLYNKDLDVEVEKEVKADGDKKSIKFRFGIPNEVDLEKHINDATKTRKHIDLMYNNSLISLLSSVEWFFSQILHFYYDKFPATSGISKKTMTLADLKTFGSIEDAEKYLIDVKIEEILRGSFDSWITVLKSELNLSMAYIDPIKEELIEIYQRRNLLVHNGSVINSIYISKVDENLRKNKKVGDKLQVDKDYLDNAICKLQKSFILIASELWKSLDKNDKERGDVLTNIVYENLLKSRWDICEGFTYFVINDKELDITDKIVAQLNYWLCKKRASKKDDFKKEIDKVDYSDKKEIFQIALFALQDKFDEVYSLLPKAFDAEQLTPEKFEEFPIFQDARESELFIKFKETTNYFKDKTTEVEEKLPPTLGFVQVGQTE
jgi:hypothetical protein